MFNCSQAIEYYPTSLGRCLKNLKTAWIEAETIKEHKFIGLFLQVHTWSYSFCLQSSDICLGISLGTPTSITNQAKAPMYMLTRHYGRDIFRNGIISFQVCLGLCLDDNGSDRIYSEMCIPWWEETEKVWPTTQHTLLCVGIRTAFLEVLILSFSNAH